jgi:integrase
MRRRGHVAERGKGKWLVKFSVDNKQRYAWVHGTRRDAEDRLAQLLAAASTGTLADPSQVTVAAYARETLDVARDLSPKTRERYGELLKQQIAPHLGDIKLQKLRPEHVEHWHAKLLEQLSPRTVNHAHKLLGKVLARAVRHNILTRNVASLVKPPAVEQREVEVLQPEQVSAVLGSLQGHTLFPIVSLALATGMRRGELLGLAWGDIDLDATKPFLRVARSLEETKAGGLRLKAPKTVLARRGITLPADTVAMLRAYRVQQMQLRLQLGMGAITAGTPVFGDIEGRPLNPHAVSRAWRRVCDAKKLPRVSFHALRHTHVSVLINAGVDVLTISRRLGHSKASMTLDVYGHLIRGGDEAAAKAIEGVLK